MSSPVFYLLAGPNGAGKSSLYRAACSDGLIPMNAQFVNADLYERDHLQHIADAQQRSEAARAWADQRRAELLKEGLSFVSETVFSHPSKLDLIREAQAHGFLVVLLVVCIDNPQLLLARVSQRVREGGHDVPQERILQRYPRTLQHLKRAVRMADMALLYDNTDMNLQPRSPKRVATCRGDRTTMHAEHVPEWAQAVLAV